MGWWPTVVFWSQRTPEDIQESLELGEWGLKGTVREDSFNVTLENRKRNSWRPVSKGKLTPAAGGTLVEIELAMHPFVVVFTLVHGMILPGIAWVMGWIGFQMGVREVKAAWLEGLGPDTLEGDDAMARVDATELMAPEVPGAEAGAPYRFRVRAGMASAVFTLRSPHGTTSLEVSTSGLRATGHVTAEVSWDDLAGAVHGPTLHGAVLELARDQGESIAIPCGWHPDEDLTWLVTYLNARDARLEASPEVQAKAREDAARLQGVVASRAIPEGHG